MYELLPYAIVLDHGLICILVIFRLHVFLAPASLSGTTLSHLFMSIDIVEHVSQHKGLSTF